MKISLWRRHAQTVKNGASSHKTFFQRFPILNGIKIAVLIQKLRRFCWIRGFCFDFAFPPMDLGRPQAKTTYMFASHEIDYVTQVQDILNLKRCKNVIIGLHATSIFLNRWHFPIFRVAPERFAINRATPSSYFNVNVIKEEACFGTLPATQKTLSG